MPSSRARPPRLPEPLGEDLRTEQADSEALADEETLEHVTLEGRVAPDLHARLLTIAASRITAALAGARLPDLHVRDCAIAGADLANLHATGAALHRTTLDHVRLTGATFAEGWLRDARLTGCRADLASLAAAKLERVVLADCDLREASFDEAQLRDVRFERCDLEGTSFARARLDRVEIVGCTLDRVRSVADLRGASMPWGDIVSNAGALAGAVGIAPLDEDEPPG